MGRDSDAGTVTGLSWACTRCLQRLIMGHKYRHMLNAAELLHLDSLIDT